MHVPIYWPFKFTDIINLCKSHSSSFHLFSVYFKFIDKAAITVDLKNWHHRRPGCRPLYIVMKHSHSMYFCHQFIFYIFRLYGVCVRQVVHFSPPQTNCIGNGNEILCKEEHLATYFSKSTYLHWKRPTYNVVYISKKWTFYKNLIL